MHGRAAIQSKRSRVPAWQGRNRSKLPSQVSLQNCADFVCPCQVLHLTNWHFEVFRGQDLAHLSAATYRHSPECQLSTFGQGSAFRETGSSPSALRSQHIAWPWRWDRIRFVRQGMVGRSQVRNSVPARTLRCGISVKNVPFLLWFVCTISIHVWDVWMDCTFALHVRDVTWAQ